MLGNILENILHVFVSQSIKTIVCVTNIPTLPRGRSEKNSKVHNHDNENYSTKFYTDNRLLQNTAEVILRISDLFCPRTDS